MLLVRFLKFSFFKTRSSNFFCPDTSSADSPTETDGQKERVDPILPLILAHPDNSSAPDANVALTNDEIQSTALMSTQPCSHILNPSIPRSRSQSRPNHRRILRPIQHAHSPLPKFPQIRYIPRATCPRQREHWRGAAQQFSESAAGYQRVVA